MPEILMYDDKTVLEKAVAEKIILLAKKSITHHGKFSIALSGGSTPEGLYKLLATPFYANQLCWNKIFIFWGDERCVPMNDKRNNGFAAVNLLLHRVPVPLENIFRINTNLQPAQAALNYESEIKKHFNQALPSFDLILLGMGTNGHTASLFPNTDILKENVLLVKEVYVKEDNLWRVSFTVPIINNADHIIFMVSGKEKASMLQIIINGKKNTEAFPAQLVNPTSKKVYCMIDKAAASSLKK